MPTATTTVDQLSAMQAFINFFQDGGTFMYIILGVLFLGLIIAIERFIFLSGAQAKNKKDWNKILPAINKGQLNSAMTIAKSSNSSIAQMTSHALTRGTMTNDIDSIQMAMEEGLMEALPKIEARTAYIATLANIATLLGLLGTIFGLINAFSAVASADPAQKADLLSASISVAMNTTAFGLMAAIPLLLIYSLLQAKTGRIVDSLEVANVKLANAYTIIKNKAASA